MVLYLIFLNWPGALVSRTKQIKPRVKYYFILIRLAKKETKNDQQHQMW